MKQHATVLIIICWVASIALAYIGGFYKGKRAVWLVKKWDKIGTNLGHTIIENKL